MFVVPFCMHHLLVDLSVFFCSFLGILVVALKILSLSQVPHNNSSAQASNIEQSLSASFLSSQQMTFHQGQKYYILILC